MSAEQQPAQPTQSAPHVEPPTELTPLRSVMNNKVGDINAETKKKEKYGQPHQFDPSFRGPIKERSCTDIICLIIFIAFIIASAAIGFYAYSRSNPLLLLYPTDSQGQLCGNDKMASRPYLHFFDLLECVKHLPTVAFTGCPTTQVCVEKCPNETWSWSTLDEIEKTHGINPLARRSQMICVDQVDFTNSSSKWNEMSLSELVKTGLCAPYFVSERPIAKRCIPEYIFHVSNITAGESLLGNLPIRDAQGMLVTMERLLSSKDVVEGLVKVQSWFQGAFADLEASWPAIVIFISIALVFSFIYIVIMRFFVAPLIWISIALFILLFLAGTTFSFWRYSQLNGTTPRELDVIADFFSQNTGVWIAGKKLLFPNETTTLWLVVGIICLVVLLIALLALCILGSRLNLAFKLFEEASIALSHMPSVLLWPILPFAFQMGVLLLAIGTAVCLATLGKASFANNPKPGLIQLPDLLTNCDVSSIVNANVTLGDESLSEVCRFAKYELSKFTVLLQFLNAFAFIWGFAFISGFGMVVLAGAFGSYYWAFRKPEDVPSIPLLGSLWRAFRYHIGSIAFGSLLVAILIIIRIILDYVMYKLKQQRHDIAVYLVKCVECCFSCLEKLVKFVTEKAYIIIAIHGKHFMAAAYEGWQLVMRNTARTVVLSGISFLVIIISKLVVTGGIVTLAYFFFHGEIVAGIPGLEAIWPKLNYFYVPIIVIAIASFAITSICFHVYEVGVETMFICFLEDCERNDGTEERPYFMSKNLAKILR